MDCNDNNNNQVTSHEKHDFTEENIVACCIKRHMWRRRERKNNAAVLSITPFHTATLQMERFFCNLHLLRSSASNRDSDGAQLHEASLRSGADMC